MAEWVAVGTNCHYLYLCVYVFKYVYIYIWSYFINIPKIAFRRTSFLTPSSIRAGLEFKCGFAHGCNLTKKGQASNFS